MKKVCIITGSRSDWGLFYSLARQLRKNSNLTLKIIATGSHLDNNSGLSYREIENDGFKINAKVAILLGSDSELDIAKTVGVAISKISDVLYKIKPDLVVLLGDRFETFSAAVASFLLKIPIAHIHGGELTEGSIDNAFRHSITKMANLHFVATSKYAKRVVQMGEHPQSVYVVGSLGIDNIKGAEMLKRTGVEKVLGSKLSEKNILITFYPETLEKEEVSVQIFKSLLKAADEVEGAMVILTRPQSDMYSLRLNEIVDGYVKIKNGKAICLPSLGRRNYLGLLRFIDVVAGNSSSGIIEVPLFGIPTINVGCRQTGRLKAKSIIDAEGSLKSIQSAFKKAFSRQFRDLCKTVDSPYGGSGAAKKIERVISRTNQTWRRKRRFFDLAF